MSYTVLVLGLAVALFGAVLLMIESGRRIGARAMARDPASACSGGSVVDGALEDLRQIMKQRRRKETSPRYSRMRIPRPAPPSP